MVTLHGLLRHYFEFWSKKRGRKKKYRKKNGPTSHFNTDCHHCRELTKVSSLCTVQYANFNREASKEKETPTLGGG